MGEDPDMAQGLRAHLADHDVACPVCGYNLRGLTGETCPECGKPVVLPRVSRWVELSLPEKLFVGGVGVGAAGVVAWVAVIVGLTLLGIGDALNLIALWVPFVMAVGVGGLAAWGTALWHAAQRRPWLAWLNVCLAWGLGSSYFLLLVLLLVASL